MFKFRPGVLTAAMIVAALAPAFAQQSPTPPRDVASTAGAAAHIQAPANGDALTSPFKVQIGPGAIPGVAPAAADKATTGRHVLLIDTTFSDQNPTQSIKADAQHILFRRDQIAALITLPAGKHRLQFVLVDASGIPFKPPVQSEAITITVRDSGATAAATANADSKETADAKAAQETQKAAEARQAAEAKRAQEAKEAQAAQQVQEEKAKLAAEQALAAKEAQEVTAALEARKALEAEKALEAKRALEAKLAREEDESRLALAKQARQAQLANEARQAEDGRRAKAARKTTAQLRVKHAKARRARSANAHLKRIQMPVVLHPEIWEVQWPPEFHPRARHRAHAHTHGQHRAHTDARQHHHGQLHHHERPRYHCHRGHHHHPSKVSNT